MQNYNFNYKLILFLILLHYHKSIIHDIKWDRLEQAIHIIKIWPL